LFTLSRFQLLLGPVSLTPSLAFGIVFAAFAHFNFSFPGIGFLNALLWWRCLERFG
jgi:hypothetical protein